VIQPGLMAVRYPTVLALDFDGVICDGLKEYFQTAWNAYCKVWQQELTVPPSELAEPFYRLRPVVETGWEMPLVIRALLRGESEAAMLQGWSAIAQSLIAEEQLDPKILAAAVDGIRDRWIATDLDSWLAEHRFYPGVIERLQTILDSGLQTLIISTKEGRFIQQLLEQQGVRLGDLTILGKEIKQPKHQTLRELVTTSSEPPMIWFVEDRFKTLLGVQKQPDLADVALFLADWGYNTVGERAAAEQNGDINLISLAQFAQDFSAWV